MIRRMFKPEWVKFIWNLEKLSETVSKPNTRAEIRFASKQEEGELVKCLELAYTLDQGWSVGLNDRLATLKKLLDKGMDHKDVEILSMVDGNRFIGVSGLFFDAESERQLLTGVTVVDEYRCRGFGTWMLHESLKCLKDRGLTSASVITRKNVAAAKFLYPKFGSVSEDVSEYSEVSL